MCPYLQHRQPSPGDHETGYADPTVIEHQTPVTGEEYAMVDVKGRKKKPTQETALYQVIMYRFWGVSVPHAQLVCKDLFANLLFCLCLWL